MPSRVGSSKISIEGYKRITRDELNYDGCMNLIVALVQQTSRDYRRALKHNAKDSMAKIERFIRSDLWYGLTGLEPEAIIQCLRRGESAGKKIYAKRDGRGKRPAAD